MLQNAPRRRSRAGRVAAFRLCRLCRSFATGTSYRRNCRHDPGDCPQGELGQADPEDVAYRAVFGPPIKTSGISVCSRCRSTAHRAAVRFGNRTPLAEECSRGRVSLGNVALAAHPQPRFCLPPASTRRPMSRLQLLAIAPLSILLLSVSFVEAAGPNWRTDFEAASAEATQDQKPLLLHFHAVWCGPCRTMER